VGEQYLLKRQRLRFAPDGRERRLSEGRAGDRTRSIHSGLIGRAHRDAHLLAQRRGRGEQPRRLIGLPALGRRAGQFL
jgi:hypothetical protein